MSNARGFRNLATRDLPGRITEYLSSGGLWNPELMDHDEVRAMLIDARDVIETLADAVDRISDEAMKNTKTRGW